MIYCFDLSEGCVKEEILVGDFWANFVDNFFAAKLSWLQKLPIF